MFHAGLTALVIATLVGICSSSGMCTYPTVADIQGVIKEMIKLGDNSTEPTIEVMMNDVRSLCLAFDEIEDHLRFVSVLVRYTCTGNPNCPLGRLPEQIESECVDGSWHYVVWETPGYSRSQTTEASFLTPIREDCVVCVSPEILIITGQTENHVLDSITHCIGCDSACTSGGGLGRCSGFGGGDSCCRYYNNSMCYNECPTPFTRITDENQCICLPGRTGYNCAEDVDCGPLNNPANGMVATPNTIYNSVATYSCNEGYSLIGNLQRTCPDSGIWTGSDPSCQIIDCPVLTAPLNGTFQPQTYQYGAMVTYSCNEGFTLVGSPTTVCMPNGLWSNDRPTCEAIPCANLPNPANGMVAIVARTATYTCNTGYNLMGDNMRTCNLDGTWTGTAPTCVVVECGELTDPENGNVSVPALEFNSIATYACHSNYNLTGDAMRMCLADATWSGTEPTCIVIPTIPTPKRNDTTNGGKCINQQSLVEVVAFLLISILCMAII